MGKNIRKNSVIRFITRDPQVHLMEMFGHCEFTPDDIKREKYVGRVKSVINDGESYLMDTISPMKGFICICNAEDVVREVELSELSTEEIAHYSKREEGYEAPNLFMNDVSSIKPSSRRKTAMCKEVARKAVSELFPDAKIAEVTVDKTSWYSKEYFRNALSFFLKQVKTKKKRAEIQGMYDDISKMCEKARFKEYYTVTVGVERAASEQDRQLHDELRKHLEKHFGEGGVVYLDNHTTVIDNWQVAVDGNFEEVSIMRDGTERTHFAYSLGPEYFDLEDALGDFRGKCLELS